MKKLIVIALLVIPLAAGAKSAGHGANASPNSANDPILVVHSITADATSATSTFFGNLDVLGTLWNDGAPLSQTFIPYSGATQPIDIGSASLRSELPNLVSYAELQNGRMLFGSGEYSNIIRTNGLDGSLLLDTNDGSGIISAPDATLAIYGVNAARLSLAHVLTDATGSSGKPGSVLTSTGTGVNWEMPDALCKTTVGTTTTVSYEKSPGIVCSLVITNGLITDIKGAGCP